MKQALVIHPLFTVYGGGETVCLHVIKALQEMNYSVIFASDNFSPKEVDETLGMGEILSKCKHFLLPKFNPRIRKFLAYRRLSHMSMLMQKMESLKPDIAFNTQSPTLYLRNAPNFSMIYDLAEFFALHTSGQFRTDSLISTARLPYEALIKRRLTPFANHATANRTFIPLSYLLEYQLELFGYPHTQVVFPPCDLIFEPKEKKKRVVQVTRVFPNKRIEDFIEIANRLREYSFIIVGADSGTERLAHPKYLANLLSQKPENMEYVEVRIRHRPDLVEESKVYLYTSIEPGINISAAQALGAGCIPVTPVCGGGSELVHAAGEGYTYADIDDAVNKVRQALEDPASPEELAQTARIFSSDKFEQRVKEIVKHASP